MLTDEDCKLYAQMLKIMIDENLIIFEQGKSMRINPDLPPMRSLIESENTEIIEVDEEEEEKMLEFLMAVDIFNKDPKLVDEIMRGENFTKPKKKRK